MLIFAPIAILIMAVAIERALPRMHPNRKVSQGQVAPSGLAIAEPEQPIVWADISRGRRSLDAADARAAYESAKKFVVARLPSNARADVRFDPWPPSPAPTSGREKSGDQTEIDRISPSLWRVRGTVSWRKGDAMAVPIRERFETDLTHGPADDRWRLIDTEWLDSHWMPDEHETGRD